MTNAELLITGLIKLVRNEYPEDMTLGQIAFIFGTGAGLSDEEIGAIGEADL